MRLIPTIIIFITTLINVYGQNKHYFVDDARWVYQTTESYEPGQIYVNSNLEEITIKGDTTINGVQYKKIYIRYVRYQTAMPPPPHPSTTSSYFENIGPQFIRYDKNIGKLYFKENMDSSEVLIYDTNLKVGDTLPSVNKYNVNLFTVKRIDTIALFGEPVKQFVLDTNNLPILNTVIQGIGGLNGLTYHQPIFPALGGGIFMTGLVCFEYGDSTFLGPEAIFNQRLCPPVSDFTVVTNDIDKEVINVFPNPSYGNISLQLPPDLIGSAIYIYNEMGMLIYTSEINKTEEKLTIKEVGLYFYQITNKLGKKISGQILIVN